MVKLLSRRMLSRIRSLRNIRKVLAEQDAAKRRNFTEDDDDIIDLENFPELFDEVEDLSRAKQQDDAAQSQVPLQEFLSQPVLQYFLVY